VDYSVLDDNDEYFWGNSKFVDIFNRYPIYRLANTRKETDSLGPGHPDVMGTKVDQVLKIKDNKYLFDALYALQTFTPEPEHQPDTHRYADLAVEDSWAAFWGGVVDDNFVEMYTWKRSEDYRTLNGYLTDHVVFELFTEISYGPVKNGDMQSDMTLGEDAI
jgi:hypothetical protein